MRLRFQRWQANGASECQDSQDLPKKEQHHWSKIRRFGLVLLTGTIFFGLLWSVDFLEVVDNERARWRAARLQQKLLGKISDTDNILNVYIINMDNRQRRYERLLSKLLALEPVPKWSVHAHRIPSVPASQGEKYAGWPMDTNGCHFRCGECVGRVSRGMMGNCLCQPEHVEWLYPDPRTCISHEHRMYWSRISDGEVSCTLSHFAALREVSQTPGAAHLVLEDDADPPPLLLANITRVLPLLPEHWEWVHLKKVTNIDQYWYWLEQAIPSAERRGYNLMIDESIGLVIPGYFYSTLAYLVSQPGAARISALNTSQNVIAFDEWVSAAAWRHPRKDVNNLYFPFDTRLRLYAFQKAWIEAHEDGNSDSAK